VSPAMSFRGAIVVVAAPGTSRYKIVSTSSTSMLEHRVEGSEDRRTLAVKPTGIRPPDERAA